jgi:hypothetical protein
LRGFRGEVLIATDQLGKPIVGGGQPQRQRVGGAISLNQWASIMKRSLSGRAERDGRDARG